MPEEAGLGSQEVRQAKQAAPIVDNKKSSETSAIKESEFIGKLAGIIAGENASEAKINWVRKNIETTRETVQQGKHETGYYPASGHNDGLRALVAYDLDNLVTCDFQPSSTEERLIALGLKQGIDFNSVGFNERKEITFNLFGRQRKITEFYKDLKGFDLKTVRGFEDGKVDVLIINLPTGAPIDTNLTENNYEGVKEGGFFCFGEHPLGGSFGADKKITIPASLYERFGLEKLAITNRHPHTIETWRPPDEPEPQAPKQGFILHKTKDIDTKLAAEAENAILMFVWAAKDTDMIQEIKGMLLIESPDAKDIKSYREWTKSLAGELIKAGVEPEWINSLKNKILGKLDVCAEEIINKKT